MTPLEPTRRSIRATGRRGRPLRRCGAVFAIAALGVAACGDDEAADPSDTQPVSTAADTQPVSTGEPEVSSTADLTIRHQAPQADVDVTYTLTCSPDAAELGGDEVDVDAQAACEALTDPAVVDRLVEGAPQDQFCTEQFGGEDTATISGTIESATVDTTVDRVDGCGISTWDDLLAPLLPPAVGVR